MTVANFFNKTVYIQRVRSTSGYKTAYNTTATADSSIQHLDRESRQRLDIVDQRGWYAYFEDGTDIQEKDRIIDKNTGQKYEVKELSNVDYGINRHIQALLIELNA